MDTITIRPGKPEDAHHWCELTLYTGPEFLPCLLGPAARTVLTRSFAHARNCFSFEHSHFIEVEGEVAGKALAYDYTRRKAEELRSFALMVRYSRFGWLRQLPCWWRSSRVIAQIEEGDYFLSSIAVYPRFRGLGLGTRLLEKVEDVARRAGSKRLVLDVETENSRAIALYERLGHRIEARSPVLRIRSRDFEFYKMVKEL